MDVHTKKQRSFNMSRIKSSGTKPELKLRKLLWAAGLRGYRVKNKIKGKPDLYYSSKKLAIFIDGCFWHQCPECFIAPKTNKKFWKEKLYSNIVRDELINEKLKKQKITALRFWEHQVEKNPEECLRIIMLKSKSVDSTVIKE